MVALEKIALVFSGNIKCKAVEPSFSVNLDLKQ